MLGKASGTKKNRPTYSCISFVHELKCTFMIDAELDDKSIVPCSSVKNVSQIKIPSLFTEANEVALQFKQSLSLLGRCHNIYNQNIVTAQQRDELDKS